MFIKRTDIKSIANKFRIEGKKIVFTNGCFDIIHSGHITYLSKAKELGDVLIVGLNSDDSVTRLKGPGRPVNNENDRVLVLDSLRFVDYVVLFNEDTPYNLIKEIIPDVLVKGGDYTINTIVGADFVSQKGGKVISIPLVEGKSTSGLLEKIRHL
ncbi:MAG: D-glycero-beta-D-manno-heptose 1-phosphate adenylyltransferase [Bacteroidetes bacterium]|nr:MAG: D-glycero-beta-D-manno-heptose 1-phosphate adenylyltransferase [Bacteroidota bacterium]